MRTAEQILDNVIGIKTKSDAFKMEVIAAMEEYGKQCKSEAIDETVRACADKCIEYTLNDDEPVAFKSSILSVAEQLKAKL